MPTKADAPSPEHADLQEEVARLRAQLAEAERRTRELHGRLHQQVRHVLSIIDIVTRRTVETSASIEEYSRHLQGRMGAIVRAHNVTLRDLHGRVDLEQLIAEELLAHAAQEGEQVSLNGPPMILFGRTIAPLSLAIHELTVNSVKFGALSAAGGVIAVCWIVGDTPLGESMVLDWHERVESPRQAAMRRGFGTEVIERHLVLELGASGSLRVDDGDVHCHIAVPLAQGLAASPPGHAAVL